jgi:hypothetical protein
MRQSETGPTLRRATLRSFDPVTYTATVQIAGSLAAYLAGLPVASEIEVQSAVPGARCLVCFFDDSNPQDGLVVAVYGAPGRSGFTGLYAQTLYNACTYR